MKIKARIAAIAVTAFAVIGVGAGVASASIASDAVHAPVHHRVTCESLDIEVPVPVGMPGDYVLTLCGKDMPVVGISCPRPPQDTGLPQPGATLQCRVSEARHAR